MRILLDTHIALWAVTLDNRLPKAARSIFDSVPRRDVFYSVVSLWEIAIKVGAQRLGVSPQDLADYLDESGIRRLPIELEHVVRVSTLPHHHRDPFDRMLVAQADIEPLKLITVDRRLALYGAMVMVV